MTLAEIVAAIRARLPKAQATLNFRDGLWRAGVVAGTFALERKGETQEEACTRLLDSVIQHQAEQSHGTWRRHG